MQFFTATIVNWKPLLEPDVFKQIIIDSLKYLTTEKRCYVYGFVIMPNHIHLLWNAQGNCDNQKNKESLLRFTAHEFRKKLKADAPDVLELYCSTQHDRQYHFWERRAYAADMYNRQVAEQKLEYMHNNPLQEKWKLAALPEDYRYSSAQYYLKQHDEFELLTHYMEHL